MPEDDLVAHRGAVSLPGSPRLPYDRLPDGLRSAIDAALGSPVVAVSPRTGGFSPGPAVVVTCADASSAFVKAVGTPLNPDTPQLMRAEAVVTAGLPASLPVPALRAHLEWADGPDEWVALVFEAFDGESAPLPWTSRAATAVVDGLTELARAATPCPVPGLPTLGERVDGPLSAWAEPAAAPPPDLHPWEAGNLAWLGTVPDRLAASGWLGGDTLVHGDLRADNLLFGADASVAFVDWA
ncbi:aminoglycoside phosphotransferase family protein [Blastococcus sp. TF02-09]|nr:aminoglycoside phosphotransferase family protein [Blastococcus sp. TF02-9]